MADAGASASCTKPSNRSRVGRATCAMSRQSERRCSSPWSSRMSLKVKSAPVGTTRPRRDRWSVKPAKSHTSETILAAIYKTYSSMFHQSGKPANNLLAKEMREVTRTEEVKLHRRNYDLDNLVDANVFCMIGKCVFQTEMDLKRRKQNK